jgi:2-haloacid dehalogenase
MQTDVQAVVFDVGGEIFHRLAQRFGLDPASTLFVDDVRANIDTARGLGMQTHRYRSPRALRRALRRLGLLAHR